MADARIRVELTAENAKKKLKEYEQGKKKAKKKAEKAEKREAKEKDKKKTEKKEEAKGGGFLGNLASANMALTSPAAFGAGLAAKRFGKGSKAIVGAIEKANLALTIASTANKTASMLGGMLREQGGMIGEVVGAPIAGFAETMEENVLGVARRGMEAAKIAAQSKASFARARINLGTDAMAGIAEFAFAEAGRKAKIEAREREETGAMVGSIIKEMTGWGS